MTHHTKDHNARNHSGPHNGQKISQTSDLFSMAIQHHQGGRLTQADALLHQMLQKVPNHPEALHLSGIIAHQLGDNDRSATLINQAIRNNPENPDYYFSLGAIFEAQGSVNDAIDCYQQAVQLKPNFVEAHYNLGNLFFYQGHSDQAILCYQNALKCKSDLVEACYNLGNAFYELGNFKKAISSYKKAAKLRPHFAEAYYNMGNAFQELEDFDNAISCYGKAIQSKPDYAAAYYNMGKAFQDMSGFNEAISCYQKALVLEPDNAKAYNNMGKAFHDLNKYHEAISSYQKAMQLEVGFVEAYYNMGNIFHDRGNFDETISWYQKALRLTPSDAEAHNKIGKLLHEQGKIDKAVSCFQKAIELEPNYTEAHLDLSTVQLLKGEFEEGWKEYEWRFQKPDWGKVYPYRHEKPRWKGSSFEGKRLLVHCEQGLGDTLQFARYLPMVKARGGTVIFETRKSLIGLFKGFPGVDELVELSPDGKTRIDFDFYVPLLSLPLIFETSLETIPDNVPYIYADSLKAASWQNQLAGEGFKVGIVWSGSPMQIYNSRRSCSLKQLAVLAKIPGVILYTLQKGDAAAQARDISGEMPLTSLGEDLVAFSDTAAVIENLDLVISVCTSVAHLAGAMGKPVWVLLAFMADWRWMMERQDSPWYPTMRLFRQETPGDWDTVIQRVAVELRTLVEERKQTSQITNISKTLDIANKDHQNGNIQAGELKRAGHYLQTGNFRKAEEIYKKVLVLYPGHPDALHLLGLIAYEVGNLEKSVGLIRKAIFNDPENAIFHCSIGNVFRDLGHLNRAILSYQKALKLKPDCVDAYNNLGNVFHSLEDYDRAMSCYQNVLKLNPDYLKAYNNMGKTFQDQGDPEKAILCYQKALEIKQDYAEARFNRSIALLLAGNFSEGWKEFEWRFARSEPERIYPHSFEKPQWDGSPFVGKRLFVHSEQGLGDTIQFSRYLPRVKTLGGTVIFETLKPMTELLKSFPGVDALSELSFDRKPDIEFDYYIPLLSLPKIFGTTLDTIPTGIPYLFATSQKREYWKVRISGVGLKVGIVWAGKPTHGNDNIRSIELDRFIRLSEIPHVNLYGLQKAEAPQKAEAEDKMVISNLGDDFQDFTDTAGAVENLDLIISVDTSVAHLAGAMGKPVWLLLPFVPDWRWLLNRDDTPWYPTMRLFRQRTRGDWDDVFRRVAEDLEGLAKAHGLVISEKNSSPA